MVPLKRIRQRRSLASSPLRRAVTQNRNRFHNHSADEEMQNSMLHMLVLKGIKNTGIED